MASLRPVNRVAEDDPVIDIGSVRIFSKRPIGKVRTAVKDQAWKGWAGRAGKADGRSPIRVLPDRLGVSEIVRTVTSKRHFFVQGRSKIPVPSHSQQLAEIVGHRAAIIDRSRKIEVIASIIVFTRTPETPQLLP